MKSKTSDADATGEREARHLERRAKLARRLAGRPPLPPERRDDPGAPILDELP